MLKPPDTPCARYFFWFVVLSAKFLIAVSWQRRRSHGSFQGLPRWCRLLVICGSIQSTQILAVQCPCSKCVSLGKWPEFRLLIFFTKHQTFPWLKLIWSFLALRVEMAIYIYKLNNHEPSLHKRFVLDANCLGQDTCLPINCLSESIHCFLPGRSLQGHVWSHCWLALGTLRDTWLHKRRDPEILWSPDIDLHCKCLEQLMEKHVATNEILMRCTKIWGPFKCCVYDRLCK